MDNQVSSTGENISTLPGAEIQTAISNWNRDGSTNQGCFCVRDTEKRVVMKTAPNSRKTYESLYVTHMSLSASGEHKISTLGLRPCASN
jgi:hypothetical protein